MADQEIFNSSRNLHFGRNCAVEAASRSSDLESQSSAGLLNFDAEIENLKDGQIVVQHEAGIEIISPPSEIITVGELEQMKEEFESLIGFIPATVVQYLNKHLVEDTQKHSRPPIIHTFNTVVLFADVSGFTALTEEMARRGPEGAEDLAHYLNSYLAQLVKCVASQGGDVFKFAGDAMIVLWPPSNEDPSILVRKAAQSALEIQKRLFNAELLKDQVVMSVKVGIGVGECSVVLAGGVRNRMEYLAAGDPLSQAFKAEHMAKPGDVILSPQAWRLVYPYFTCTKSEDIENGYALLESCKEPLGRVNISKTVSVEFHGRSSINAIRNYVPGSMFAYLNTPLERYASELRRVAILFLNVGFSTEQLATISEKQNGEALQKIQEVVFNVQESVYKFEGSLNKFLFDDKGSTLIAVFGLPPLAHVEDSLRAIMASIEISSKLKNCNMVSAIGVTTGTAFCGVAGSHTRKEYAVLGDVVNLSARLMQHAMKTGKLILCDEETSYLTRGKVIYEKLDEIFVKGKKDKIKIFEPLGAGDFGLKAGHGSRDNRPKVSAQPSRSNSVFENESKVPQRKKSALSRIGNFFRSRSFSLPRKSLSGSSKNALEINSSKDEKNPSSPSDGRQLVSTVEEMTMDSMEDILEGIQDEEEKNKPSRSNRRSFLSRKTPKVEPSLKDSAPLPRAPLANLYMQAAKPLDGSKPKSRGSKDVSKVSYFALRSSKTSKSLFTDLANLNLTSDPSIDEFNGSSKGGHRRSSSGFSGRRDFSQLASLINSATSSSLPNYPHNSYVSSATIKLPEEFEGPILSFVVDGSIRALKLAVIKFINRAHLSSKEITDPDEFKLVSSITAFAVEDEDLRVDVAMVSSQGFGIKEDGTIDLNFVRREDVVPSPVDNREDARSIFATKVNDLLEKRQKCNLLVESELGFGKTKLISATICQAPVLVCTATANSVITGKSLEVFKQIILQFIDFDSLTCEDSWEQSDTELNFEPGKSIASIEDVKERRKKYVELKLDGFSEFQDTVSLFFEFLESSESSKLGELCMLNEAEKTDVVVNMMFTLIQEYTVDDPIILVIDDAGYLDPTSWKLIHKLTVEIPQNLLLVLATFPIDESYLKTFNRRPMAEFQRIMKMSHTSIVRLKPFPDHWIYGVIINILGVKAMRDNLAQFLLNRAKGNLLITKELLFELRKKSLIQVIEHNKQKICAFSAEFGDAPCPIPTSMLSMLGCRLDRIPTLHQLILKTASLIGSIFAASLVKDSFPVMEHKGSIEDVLETLVDDWYILRRVPESDIDSYVIRRPDDIVYQFRDEFMRDVAQSRLLKKFQRPLEISISKAMEDIQMTQPRKTMKTGNFTGIFEISKTGSLANKSFQKQYKTKIVKLTGNQLMMFNRNDPSKPWRMINLVEGCKLILVSEEESGRTFTLRLESKNWMKHDVLVTDRTVYFYLSFAEMYQCQEWKARISSRLEEEPSAKLARLRSPDLDGLKQIVDQE